MDGLIVVVNDKAGETWVHVLWAKGLVHRPEDNRWRKLPVLCSATPIDLDE